MSLYHRCFDALSAYTVNTLQVLTKDTTLGNQAQIWGILFVYAQILSTLRHVLPQDYNMDETISSLLNHIYGLREANHEVQEISEQTYEDDDQYDVTLKSIIDAIRNDEIDHMVEGFNDFLARLGVENIYPDNDVNIGIRSACESLETLTSSNLIARPQSKSLGCYFN